MLHIVSGLPRDLAVCVRKLIIIAIHLQVVCKFFFGCFIRIVSLVLLFFEVSKNKFGFENKNLHTQRAMMQTQAFIFVVDGFGIT